MRKLFSCINWKVEVLERVQIQDTKEGSWKKAFILEYPTFCNPKKTHGDAGQHSTKHR